MQTISSTLHCLHYTHKCSDRRQVFCMQRKAHPLEQGSDMHLEKGMIFWGNCSSFHWNFAAQGWNTAIHSSFAVYAFSYLSAICNEGFRELRKQLFVHGIARNKIKSIQKTLASIPIRHGQPWFKWFWLFCAFLCRFGLCRRYTASPKQDHSSPSVLAITMRLCQNVVQTS